MRKAIFFSTLVLSCTVNLAFVLTSTTPRNREQVQLAAAAKKTTLADDTTWNIRMVLRGVATEKGKKVDEILNLKLNFMEEEGYEPPQGIVKLAAGEDSRFRIAKSRWLLSEDPNDRKDGLWVWGLFKEPLYPFLLLNLQTEPIPLSKGEDEEVADAIKPLQLYAQINHSRDKEKGVILSPTTDLKVRQMETVAADVFGVGTVDLYEEVNIGTISIQPALAVSASKS